MVTSSMLSTIFLWSGPSICEDKMILWILSILDTYTEKQIFVCADCGGTWQVLERVIISLGDNLYRLSVAKLLYFNKSWHWEQLLVFCPEVEKIQFWNTDGILYCIPEHGSCHRIISVWETCICQELESVLHFYWALKWVPELLSWHCIFWKCVLTLDGAPVLKYE